MKFVDLQRQRERLDGDLERRVARVMSHGHFIAGPEVEELEQRLSSWTGHDVVTCASGTDALALGLRALGAGPGDAVFVPSFTFVATASAVVRVGATPIFVDLAPGSFDICPDDLLHAVSELEAMGQFGRNRTRLRPWGAIAVGLFGFPTNIPALERVCNAKGLRLIEDGAQSLFARRGERLSPAQTELGATSFFPSKVLGCYGDGGAMFCRDRELGSRLRLLRSHGKPRSDADAEIAGDNSRLDTVQAAVLLAKLEIVSDELRARQTLAERYRSALADMPSLLLPTWPEDVVPVFSLYTVRLAERWKGQNARLRRALDERGVPSRIYYERPIHQQRAYADHWGARRLPVTESAARDALSLPFHPYMTEEEVDCVVSALKALVA